MKTVFAASEAAPFIKTGGLGDVAQALPLALSQIPKNEVHLFLPYYKSIKENPDIAVEKIDEFQVSLSWRSQYVGLFRLKSKKRKLRVYFIDNEYYFKRENIYGEGDDGERFAYFSKAILESLCRMDFCPDIIHCNDWQTALIPTLLHAFYQETLGSAKTVFSIHNIEYQGWADPYFLGGVLGLGEAYENTFRYHGSVNFLKSAILSCDALTTVSKTYAEEICFPEFAHGLDPVIRDHKFKLSGIVNGIDFASNDPASDQNLACNYSAENADQGKKECKAALQRELSLPERSDVPLIGMVSRLVRHKGLEILCDAIEEWMQWDVQIAIVGTGDWEYEDRLKEIADAHPDRISVNLCFNKALASRIYAGSDIYLMPSKSEPCGLSQLIAMHYGTVPLVHETGGLKDTVIPFDPETGLGLGFTFQRFQKDDLHDALRRTLTVFAHNKLAWSRAAQNGMTSDFSWNQPAGEYMKLYRQITD